MHNMNIDTHAAAEAHNDGSGSSKHDVDATVTADEAAVPCVLGDCVIQLSHATTYEPPLYLFPELLPRVAQGSAPVAVWDAVADAIDVAHSHWTLVNVRQLQQLVCASDDAAVAADYVDDDKDEEEQDNNNNSNSAVDGDKRNKTTSTTTAAAAAAASAAASSPRRGAAAHTLASLVASNRLLAAGLSARVLQRSQFSSAAMIAELARLRRRAGLTADEGAALMTNHFVNLLAWRKLREINDGRDGVCDGAKDDDDDDDTRTVAAAATSTAVHASSSSSSSQRDGDDDTDRRRARDDEDTASPSSVKRTRLDDATTTAATAPLSPTAALQSSPTPWSTLVDDARFAAQFVAGSEAHVEQRVPLLRTLAQLYRRPWRTLSSCGVQTDQQQCLPPPGTMNTTSPYAHVAHTAAGALLDVHHDLHWPCAVDTTTTAAAAAADTTTSSSSSAAAAAPFVLLVEQPRHHNDGAATRRRGVVQRVPLHSSCTYVGRVAGVQHTALLGAVDVHVGVGEHSAQPQHISEVHCALLLQTQSPSPPSPSSSPSSPQTQAKATTDDAVVVEVHDNNDKGSDGQEQQQQQQQQQQQTGDASSSSFALWLVNYSCNGVRVVGARWTLTEAVRLYKGSRFVVGDVHLRIVDAHHASGSYDDDDEDEDEEGDGDAKRKLASSSSGNNKDDDTSVVATRAGPVKTERNDE